MIAAIAIVIVGGAWIAVYWKQQEKNREQNQIDSSGVGPVSDTAAESLVARMASIDADMADLRTRVETGPGNRIFTL